MSDENKLPTEEETTETPVEEPRKIMLGKRVLRHFNVRSGFRGGVANDDSKVTTLCVGLVRCNS